MEKLKIWFTDFWPEWKDEDFITPLLSNTFELELDSKNPDVLFYSIFRNNNTTYNCKKILYLAENIRQGYNDTIRRNINLAVSGADYTITFDPQTSTNYCLPLWQVFIMKNSSYWNKLKNRINHENFDRFCSFTVSNPSNLFRNGIFNQISQYKKVHSYGKYLTNCRDLIEFSKGKYWRDAKDEFFDKYKHKFSITYENTSYPYYTTEKLMDGFLSGSVPIYFGDPKVSENWNEKAFINVHSLNKQNKNLMEELKHIDNINDRFLEIYNEPVFTEEQLNRHMTNIVQFGPWLIDKILN